MRQTFALAVLCVAALTLSLTACERAQPSTDQGPDIIETIEIDKYRSLTVVRLSNGTACVVADDSSGIAVDCLDRNNAGFSSAAVAAAVAASAARPAYRSSTR